MSLVSLPPLLLEVLLPPLYPLRLPPTILSIHATHSWLNPATVRLQHRLVNLWQPGEGALYTWIEWIRGGDFLDALGLTNQTDGKIGIRFVFVFKFTSLLHSDLLLGQNSPSCP